MSEGRETDGDDPLRIFSLQISSVPLIGFSGNRKPVGSALCQKHKQPWAPRSSPFIYFEAFAAAAQSTEPSGISRTA